MNLKISPFEKEFIEEAAALSGNSASLVREIAEFLYLRQVEQLISTGKLTIPFIGDLAVSYTGELIVEGRKLAEMQTSLEPSLLFRRIVGDIEDDESELLRKLLENKTRDAAAALL